MKILSIVLANGYTIGVDKTLSIKKAKFLKVSFLEFSKYMRFGVTVILLN